jgi:hypothetical protein
MWLTFSRRSSEEKLPAFLSRSKLLVKSGRKWDTPLTSGSIYLSLPRIVAMESFPERTIWWRSSRVKSQCKCWTTSPRGSSGQVAGRLRSRPFGCTLASVRFLTFGVVTPIYNAVVTDWAKRRYRRVRGAICRRKWRVVLVTNSEKWAKSQ